MTVDETRTLAESYLDDDIDDADAILWANDFLEEPELLEVFRYTDEQEITVTDTTAWTDRTSGHLGILEIWDDDDEPYTGDYELNFDGSKIRIPYADTYTITSIVQPTAITATSQTPVINTVFHRSMATYMAGKFKLKDNDQNPDGLRLVAEGMAKARRAARLLVNQDKRSIQLTKRSTWG